MCGTGGNLKQGPQGGVDEFLGMRQGRNGQVNEPGAFEKPFRFDNQTGPAPSTSTLSLYTLCISLHSAKITFTIALPRHRTGHGQLCPGREAWYTVPSPPACVSSSAFSSSLPQQASLHGALNFQQIALIRWLGASLGTSMANRPLVCAHHHPHSSASPRVVARRYQVDICRT